MPPGKDVGLDEVGVAAVVVECCVGDGDDLQHGAAAGLQQRRARRRNRSASNRSPTASNISIETIWSNWPVTVAIVLQPDLDLVGEPCRCDARRGRIGLLAARAVSAGDPAARFRAPRIRRSRPSRSRSPAHRRPAPRPSARDDARVFRPLRLGQRLARRARTAPTSRSSSRRATGGRNRCRGHSGTRCCAGCRRACWRGADGADRPASLAGPGASSTDRSDCSLTTPSCSRAPRSARVPVALDIGRAQGRGRRRWRAATAACRYAQFRLAVGPGGAPWTRTGWCRPGTACRVAAATIRSAQRAEDTRPAAACEARRRDRFPSILLMDACRPRSSGRATIVAGDPVWLRPRCRCNGHALPPEAQRLPVNSDDDLQRHQRIAQRAPEAHGRSAAARLPAKEATSSGPSASDLVDAHRRPSRQAVRYWNW